MHVLIVKDFKKNFRKFIDASVKVFTLPSKARFLALNSIFSKKKSNRYNIDLLVFVSVFSVIADQAFRTFHYLLLLFFLLRLVWVFCAD